MPILFHYPQSYLLKPDTTRLNDTTGSFARGADCSILSRASIVRYVTLLGLLSALLISVKLWLVDDFFGPIAVFTESPVLAYPIDVVWFGLMIALLLAALGQRSVDRWIQIWCIVALLRCVWDRITWQPYLLQYFCMMLVFGWYRTARIPRESDSSDTTYRGDAEGQLDALRVIVFSVYFWSGLAKFNYRFLQRAAQSFFGPLLPADVVQWIDQIIWLIPIMETLLAIGLLSRRFHKFAVLGIFAMHLLILWMIGPLGSDFNHVVWPWNVAMMVVVFTLFWRVPVNHPRRMSPLGSKPVHKIVFVLCTVCPALSYAGWWPGYLSFRMYSSREPRAQVQFNEVVAESFPNHVRKWIVWHPEGKPVGRLSILIWSDQTLGAYVPTEIPVYKHVARKLWQRHQKDGDMYLILEHEPNMWTGKARLQSIDCKDL